MTVPAEPGQTPEGGEPEHIELRIRQATIRDFERITNFYRNNPRETLPIPSVKDIGETIDSGRIILLETTIRPSEIQACGAIFRYTPSNCKTYVGELAGMLALPAVNGLEPINTQTLLLGARLLGHAATEATAGPGRTNSLITIVKDGNQSSLKNVLAAGFHPLEERPDWIKYDEQAWLGSIVKEEWKYFYATNETIVSVAKKLEGVGLFGGLFKLRRINRSTKRPQLYTVHSELRDIMHATEDLRQLIAGGHQVDLCPPPSSLVFWTG
jgi:hypothetical protein